MNASELHATLMERYRANSLYETDRHYLGMSGAGECPRKWYWRTVAPIASDAATWFAWAGYTWEARVLELLGVEQQSREIVASFDGHYRGHTDHEMPDGTLVEIKSVSWERYTKLVANQEPTLRNVMQCIAYMRHGGFPHAVLVYVARDIPPSAFSTEIPLPFVEFDVFNNTAMADVLDYKAKIVLTAMDRGEPPACSCGYCTA